MKMTHKIAPCLWFDHEAEEAANFYVSIFPNSKISKIAHYGDAGYDIHHQKKGTVLTVGFELDGQPFTALNGGPEFKFNEALSLQIYCASQQELDHYWDKLRQGGDPKAQVCGWLKDKYGVSWQVVPQSILEMWDDSEGAERLMTALLKMKKLDIAELERAYRGESASAEAPPVPEVAHRG